MLKSVKIINRKSHITKPKCTGIFLWFCVFLFFFSFLLRCTPEFVPKTDDFLPFWDTQSCEHGSKDCGNWPMKTREASNFRQKLARRPAWDPAM